MRAYCGLCLALVVVGVFVTSPVRAQSITTAGEFSIEPPTLLSLGFDWKISGDDNRNAQVDVRYRKRSETAWRKALPLLRLQREWVNGGPPLATDNPLLPRFPFDYVVPNMFSGSVLNLDPDTEYECRLAMSDPDGVRGEATKTVTVRTRKEPQPATGGKTYHVYPVDWKGPKEEPAFTGLMSAYYMGTAHYDYQNAYPPRVKPGDIILVHAGLYVSDRFHYMNGAARPGYLSLGTVFDGTYYLTASGTPDRPIAIKGAGDGEAIFDGDGAQNLFNVMAANYNYFEGLTIRNTNVAFLAGIKDIAGSSGFTLKRSRIYNVGRAVQDDYQNLVYNAPASGSLKFVATPAGVLVYQNTFVGETVARGPASNVHFRNNLIVAQDALDPVFAVGTYTNYSTSDYNAFRPNPGKDDSFEWNTPPAGVAADYKTAPVVHRFKTLREYSDATGQDKHSVLVDYDVFVNVTMPDKSDPQRLYKPDGLDFRLKPGSAAADAGIALPSINDDFSGRAPDIGAYESGRPVPHYGPR